MKPRATGPAAHSPNFFLPLGILTPSISHAWTIGNMMKIAGPKATPLHPRGLRPEAVTFPTTPWGEVEGAENVAVETGHWEGFKLWAVFQICL